MKLIGISIFFMQNRISVADIIGFGGSEIASSKPDGCVKSWDSSIDLVNILKHDIRDGQLSFRGKRVLELSCSYGIAGIFACLKVIYFFGHCCFPLILRLFRANVNPL
jgi:hypothetical protein